MQNFSDLTLHSDRFLSDLTKCYLAPLASLTENVAKILHLPHAGWIRRIFCDQDPSQCEFPVVGKEVGSVNLAKISKVCLRRPHLLVKTISIRNIDSMHSLLGDPTVKLIILVRDPRAVLQSLLNMAKSGLLPVGLYEDALSASLTLEERVQTLSLIHCNTMLDEITALENECKGNSRAQCVTIRYEDIVDNTRLYADRMLKIMGLNLDKDVLEWIPLSTNGTPPLGSRHNPEYIYSTIRKSSFATAHAWRKELSYTFVEMTQKNCAKLMEQLNYVPVTRSTMPELRMSTHSQCKMCL